MLYVITKSNWGGAQRYVYDLATALPKDQFEVSVAFGQEGLLAKKLREARIALFPIKALQRDISIANDVKSFLNSYGFSVPKNRIVCTSIHLKRPVSGRWRRALRAYHGLFSLFTGGHLLKKRNIFWRLFALLGSWITALLSHKIIVVSDYDLKVARKMPGVAHKTVRIYNGIDFHFPLGSGDVVRHSFPKGVRITGTVGELTKNKNQIALIEQAKNDPTMYVAIVGDGEDRLYLKKK